MKGPPIPAMALPVNVIQYQTAGSKFSLKIGNVERAQTKPPRNVKNPPMKIPVRIPKRVRTIVATMQLGNATADATVIILEMSLLERRKKIDDFDVTDAKQIQ
jgi:hypothetical protein